ncbi:MAG: HutD family protein [Bacteroidota bacterium]
MLIIPASLQKTTNWSGGTTTQLYIYPEGTSYAARDFLFRISTATIETETSTFTSLPAFQRILLILKGSLAITHKDRYSKQLHPFDTDRFDGAWKTSAIGKVTDFNLMMAANARGDCTHELLHSGQSKKITAKNSFYGIYWLQGSAVLTYNSNECSIKSGDFISLLKGETLTILAQGTSNWVSVEVNYS